MGADWDLDEAAARIKRAGLNPSGWPDALSFLAETIGGTGAVVFGTDSHVAHAPSSLSLQQTMAEYTQDGWYERDRRRDGVELMLRNGVMTDRDLDEASFTSDFYRDFLPRHECQWFAGVGFITGEDLWCLAMERSAARGPFQDHEVDRLKTLRRPLGDAATLTRVFADRHALATMDALELVDHAAIVCDQKGKIVAFNRLAGTLLGAAYDPKLKALRFEHGASATLYARILRAAIDGVTATSASPLAGTLIDNAGRNLIVRAISLHEKNEFVFYQARVVLLFKPQPPDLKARMLKYGLTPAEVRIVEELRSGNDVAGIAMKRRVKEASIRTQLKSIFAKTDVHSQSQLVALAYGGEADVA